jgi:predicted nucleic acid-binding protein
MGGLTFDTGVLIALERRQQRAAQIFALAVRSGMRITVPAPVVAEWWRGRTDLREDLLAAVDVEPMTEALGRLAGEALARVRGATTIDALVMASAALREDVVYTSDYEDLEKLRRVFSAVRVLRI